MCAVCIHSLEPEPDLHGTVKQKYFRIKHQHIASSVVYAIYCCCIYMVQCYSEYIAALQIRLTKQKRTQHSLRSFTFSSFSQVIVIHVTGCDITSSAVTDGEHGGMALQPLLFFFQSCEQGICGVYVCVYVCTGPVCFAWHASSLFVRIVKAGPLEGFCV